MALVIISVLKIYFVIVVIIMLVYAVRHFIFSYNRIFGRQRMYYNDIYDHELPFISVLIPMHNEEKVLQYVLDALLESDYDRNLLEIVPINDNSSDRTAELLNEYAKKYPFIRPLHRESKWRGKPVSLNDGLRIAKGEIIIVFDADYRPGNDLLRQLALAFKDPEVGAVMGRVIPYNTNKNLLTRLLNLERSGGYQVDQQARYNLKLIPQYGGTVGGFRKNLMLETGGFNTRILAEDTELTFRLYTMGWKVIYANTAECYEEVPETWDVRARQIRRWSRGHNAVMFRYFFPVIFSKNMNLREKIDGILLLIVYSVPFLLALGIVDSLALFFLGEMNIISAWWVLLFLGAYNSYGNFAPFYQIATALLIDGVRKDVLLLPLITFNFYFYLWNISLGFLEALIDLITGRNVIWAKTERFVKNNKVGAEENWHTS
ncbi:MAG: glycosyltransferase family 2 protein [Vulcanibacillus sp.]